jgi:tetratricopeptide (TPR) repeat protein
MLDDLTDAARLVAALAERLDAAGKTAAATYAYQQAAELAAAAGTPDALALGASSAERLQVEAAAPPEPQPVLQEPSPEPSAVLRALETGDQLAEAGDVELARRAYAAGAILADPRKDTSGSASDLGLGAIAAYKAAAIWDEQDQVEKACRSYRRAVELGRANGSQNGAWTAAIAATALGLCARRAKRRLRSRERGLADSSKAFRDALALEPLLAEDHLWVLSQAARELGSNLDELGRLEEAEAAYRTAIRLGGDSGPEGAREAIGAALTLATRFDEQQASDEAGALYRTAVELASPVWSSPDLVNGARAAYLLGVNLARAGGVDEAEAAYKQALEFGTAEPTTQDGLEAATLAACQLGHSLRARGERDAAAGAYRMAVKLGERSGLEGAAQVANEAAGAAISLSPS